MRDIRHGDTPSSRSIRNIPVGHRKRAATPESEYDPEPMDDSYPPEPEFPRRRPRRARRRFWLYAAAIVAACAVLGLLLSTVFSGATVTIVPRTESVGVPAALQAQLNAPVGVLPYQSFSVTRSASQSVPASGTQRVSRPASGTITITNAYSAESQRLIANTRFEAPDGKIYRIRESVTVPGQSGGKAGSVTATVYADSPGEAYNKGATTFTIPGFKGDPRYDKFGATAQSISGGFVGEEPAVAASDLAAAKTALQKDADAQVRAAAAAEIPEGFIAIPGTLEVTFADIAQATGEGGKANLTQSATASGAIVRAADLAAAIASRSVEGYQGEAVLFGDDTQMDVTVATSSRAADGALTLNLSGTAELVWQLDPNALTQALIGKKKSEFEAAIQAFHPAIDKAEASVRPFWRGQFPDTADKIRIKIQDK